MTDTTTEALDAEILDAPLDLMLAILQINLKPGEVLTRQQIADFCGVTAERIGKIEKAALLKLKRRLRKVEGD